MENDEKKLPIEVKQNNTLQKLNARIPAITDSIKRVGKVVGQAALGIGLMTTSAFISVVAPYAGIPAIVTAANIASFGVGVSSMIPLVKSLSSAVFKEEPSLAFQTSKNSKGEMKITQNALSIPSYMKGLNKVEKAQLMGLQSLIGLQRYKVNLKGTNFSLDENGNKIYDQKVSTVTHGVNLKTIEALEKLGYIKIDEESPKKFGAIGKLIGQEYLLTERVGFNELNGIKEIAKEFVAIHKGTTTQPKKDFSKITFRLTDKDFDFEELYNTVNVEKKSLPRLSTLFLGKNSRHPGILALSNENRNSPVQVIDIAYDKFKRPYLVYGAEKSFGDRMEEKFRPQKIMKEQKESFDKTVQVEKTPEVQIAKVGEQEVSQSRVQSTNEDITLDNL